MEQSNLSMLFDVSAVMVLAAINHLINLRIKLVAIIKARYLAHLERSHTFPELAQGISTIRYFTGSIPSHPYRRLIGPNHHTDIDGNSSGLLISSIDANPFAVDSSGRTRIPHVNCLFGGGGK